MEVLNQHSHAPPLSPVLIWGKRTETLGSVVPPSGAYTTFSPKSFRRRKILRLGKSSASRSKVSRLSAQVSRPAYSQAVE